MAFHHETICWLQATYDPQLGEFILHTPKDTASKFWIGGAAQHGKVSQLHAFLGMCSMCLTCPGNKR